MILSMPAVRYLTAGILHLLRCRWCVFRFRSALFKPRFQAIISRSGSAANGAPGLFGCRADFLGALGHAFTSPAGRVPDLTCGPAYRLSGIFQSFAGCFNGSSCHINQCLRFPAFLRYRIFLITRWPASGFLNLFRSRPELR